VARGGFVLLKNEGHILPLDKAEIKKLAVIGLQADPAVIGGGGSSWTKPNHTVSVLEGLKEVAGASVEIIREPGVDSEREWKLFGKSEFVTPDGKPGLQAEYFDNTELEGEPVLKRIDERLNFGWHNQSPGEGLGVKGFSVRWRGAIRAPRDGEYLIYVSSQGNKCRLLICGEEVFNGDGSWGPTSISPVSLKQGEDCEFLLEYRRKHEWNGIHLGWEHADDPVQDRERAMQAAQDADAVVLCVGFSKESEGEGHDRTYGLGDDMEKFISDVGKANNKTTVVLFAGGSVATESWLKDVSGLLHVWYPGQEGGKAAAEIIYGEVNPSGKLPFTWEKQLEDRSSYDNYHDDDNDKKVQITDGVFCGYRHFDKQAIEPRFAFGHGLSYTEFEYSELKLSAEEMSAEDRITVSFQLANKGQRAGVEVAQLYVSDLESSLPRPVKELKGFGKLVLAPGENKTVSIELDRKALEFFDPAKGWVVEPGEFEILIGASAVDIRLSGKFKLK
jgi:beta-glucosidase